MKHRTIGAALAWWLMLTVAMAGLTACSGGQPEESRPAVSEASDESKGEETSHTVAPTRADPDLPDVVWVVADQLTVSDAAGLGNAVIGGLQYGDRVAVLGREGDWLKIDFAGAVGYISRQYVQYTDPAIDPPTTTQELTAPTTAPVVPESAESGEGDESGESGESGESEEDTDEPESVGDES